jgi:hypothetical protein
MAEKPEYVLFLMKTCKHSLNFLTKLKSKPELFSKFNIVDVEEIPSIPNEVTDVPCVYDGKQVYPGKNAFKWLNEKMNDFLLPADDSLMYSFVNGQEEQIFSNFSMLDQQNGSSGLGDSSSSSGGIKLKNKNDKSLESLIAARDAEIK